MSDAKLLIQNSVAVVTKTLSNNQEIASKTIPLVPTKNDIQIYRGKNDSTAFLKRYSDQSKFPKTNTVDELQLLAKAENGRCMILGTIEFAGSIENIDSHLQGIINNCRQTGNELGLDLVITRNIFTKFHQLDSVNHYELPQEFIAKLQDNLFNQFIYLSLILEFQRALPSTDNEIEIESNNNNNNNNNAQPASQEISDNELNGPTSKIETQEFDKTINHKITSKQNLFADYFKTTSSVDQESVYKVYSKEYDLVIKAEDFVSHSELQTLKKQFDNTIASLDKSIFAKANNLKRKLLAKHQRFYELGLEEGIIDSARLSQIVVRPGFNNFYKQLNNYSILYDTTICLLIDNSGSMRGKPILTAAITAELLLQVLHPLGISSEVIGFTTREWNGGRLRKKFEKHRIANPGRLNELLHIIYKDSFDHYHKATRNLGLMLKDGILKENIDGESLEFAYKRILKQPQKRKIIIVISDGAPIDDATISTNGSNYLDSHLRQVVTQIEKSRKIELLAIGIGHDVRNYYKNAIKIRDIDALGDVLFKELTNLL